MSTSSEPEITTKTKTREREAAKTRRIPLYHLILHNDDVHSVEFVVETVMKALGYNEQKATLMTLEAHNSGRAIVWTGTKELAELKLEQITSFHEIRERDQTKLGPLTCTIEPAPGG
jgi:ATP-dependent Clp protease adaptor protein ClpS